MATYRLNLIGYTWSGHRASYAYNVNDVPKDALAVKRIAVDFESVEDYEVVKVTHGGDWAHEWTKREIVRAWENETHADVYSELQGA